MIDRTACILYHFSNIRESSRLLSGALPVPVRVFEGYELIIITGKPKQTILAGRDFAASGP